MKTLHGSGKAIQKIRLAIDKITATNTNVLITGQPGTGKTVAARVIHEKSSHGNQPFALLNVAAIDEIKLRSIVQSVLTKRQFLNPTTSDHGNFDLPDGATIILDHLDHSSAPAQTIILEFVQRLIAQEIKIRVILLLDSQAKDLMRGGSLLPEFAKMTKGWHVLHMPPLRERSDDIPELIEQFVLETAKEMNLGEVVIDVNAISVLVRKEWKGNVQELKTFVERAMLLSEDKETFKLPEALLDEQSELMQMLERIDKGVDFAIDQSMGLIEKKILERVLKKFEFNQSRAARFLKITEDTLRYRMKKLGIQNL